METKVYESFLPVFLANSQIFYVAIINLEGKYVYVNDLFNKRYSFICSNFVGQHSYIAIHPTDHGVCAAAVEKCFADPQTPVKVRLRKPDTNLDDYYWTEWEFSVYTDSSKEVLGILCIGVDITQTEIATKRAVEFAGKVETILEEITDGFYQLDRNWNFLKMNRAAEAILGVSRKELLGASIWERFPQHEGSIFPEKFREAISENKRITFDEYRADLNKWFSTTCYPSVEGLTVFFKDHTAEKISQDQLRESENKLRAILNSTTDANILLSNSGHILNLNRAASEFLDQYLGKKLNTGDPFAENFNEEDRVLFEDNFRRALSGENPRYIGKKDMGGHSIWLSVEYQPVFEESGERMGVALNFVDITAIKVAEEKFSNEANKLRSILESTTDSFVLLGLQYEVLCFNQVMQKDVFKSHQKEIQYGDDFRLYLDPQIRSVFLDSFQQASTGEPVAFEFEYQAGGEVNWFQIRFFPTYNEKQEIFGVSYNYKNISKRKFSELKIRQSEAMLKTLYDSTNESVTFIDPNFRILFNNRLSKEITKGIFGKEAQAGDHSLQYYVPEIREEFVQYYQEVLKGKTIHLEKEFQGIWWSFSLYPVYDEEGTIIGISDNVTDITARKLNELRIIEQNQKLKDIAWLQSHKVRRPLANVVGIYNVLKEDKNLTPEEKESFLEVLLSEVYELDRILHEIVDISREVK